MSPTKSMPRLGLAVALLLVVPAAAAADSEVSYNGTEVIYVDEVGANDRVEVVNADGDATIGFRPLTGGAAIDAVAPCAANGSGGASCPAAATALFFQLNAGDDRVELDALAPPLVRPADVEGGPGNDAVVGGAGVDDVSGGSGDDLLVGLTNGDRFRGQDGRDTLNLSAVAAGITLTLDGVANDGAGDAGTADVEADVEVVLGTAEADDMTGAAGAQELSGGGGADILEGGGDADVLRGDAGDDTILALDRAVDDVACGGGAADTVQADWNDTVAADCEQVTRAARDDDADGAPFDADCNDADPGIRPGAGDVPGNGVDENCDGSDAVVDADGDGAAVTVDCDDANALRRPGATDAPGNGIDEDCSGADAAFPALNATITAGWKVFPKWTRLTSLGVRGAPAGARVELRCKGTGCPFTRRTARVGANGRVSLTRRIRAAKLRPGAIVEVRVLAANADAVGKVLRIAIRPRKAPRRSGLCLAPGASRPGACG